MEDGKCVVRFGDHQGYLGWRSATHRGRITANLKDLSCPGGIDFENARDAARAEWGGETRHCARCGRAMDHPDQVCRHGAADVVEAHSVETFTGGLDLTPAQLAEEYPDYYRIHAVMEYADGQREPLCQAGFQEGRDFYNDEAQAPPTCDDCQREMQSRGWVALQAATGERN